MIGHKNKEFCIEVWGDYACFTRPELKVERVSYDVMTPSAARYIFQAIFWKPAINWIVKRIEVLSPIKWISVKRNEVAKTASTSGSGVFIESERQQKSGMLLKDVRYRIYAELDFIPVGKRPPRERKSKLSDTEEERAFRADENPAKYNAIFERRASKGQCFTTPYLGCREFSANFRLVSDGEELPPPISETRDLGIMLFDMDFTDMKNPMPMFFRAKLENGVLNVPNPNSGEILR